LPRKYNYKVPKGTKDCEGKECDKDYNFEIEIPDVAATIQQIPTGQITGTTTTQQLLPPIQSTSTAPPEIKPDEPRKLKHEEIAELIPTNYGKCPGGDCGHMKIKNPNQSKKHKICSNGKCESNSVRKDQPCPTCGKDFDEDEWKELEDGVNLTDEDENEQD